MSTAYSKVKAAWIRLPGYPIGRPAPLYLNCPCGARPVTHVRCACSIMHIHECPTCAAEPEMLALLKRMTTIANALAADVSICDDITSAIRRDAGDAGGQARALIARIDGAEGGR